MKSSFFCFGDSISDVSNKLKSDFALVIKWFHENCGPLNAGKCKCMRLEKNT